MAMLYSQKGSEWRRWDLHIHTPFTKLANAYKGKDEESIWDEYIKTIHESSVQAFGITPSTYFCLICSRSTTLTGLPLYHPFCWH